MPYKDPSQHRDQLRAASKKWREAHPETQAAMNADWYQRNKEASIARVTQWRKDNPEGGFNRNLRVKYDLTREQFDQMVADQDGKCAICREPPSGEQRGGPRTRLDVDHDHVTGRVRGLLCHPCNLMLGHARDSAETLMVAVEYLRRAS